MLFSDKYKEIQSSHEARYIERSSLFISLSFRVYSLENIKKHLFDVKKKYKKATHYCYAYILNADKSSFKYDDDGEPSSTAGKQILNQLYSYDLTNILVIVVRYYGGKKLGITGLIKSYKKATIEVLIKSEIVTKYIKENFQIEFTYSQINNIMNVVKKNDLEIIESNFDLNCKLIFAVVRSNSEKVCNEFITKLNIVPKYLN